MLPSIQNSPLVFTQETHLRQALVQVSRALVETAAAPAPAAASAPAPAPAAATAPAAAPAPAPALAPDAASAHQQALLKLLLQLRAGVLLAEPFDNHNLQQVSLLPSPACLCSLPVLQNSWEHALSWVHSHIPCLRHYRVPCCMLCTKNKTHYKAWLAAVLKVSCTFAG